MTSSGKPDDVTSSGKPESGKPEYGKPESGKPDDVGTPTVVFVDVVGTSTDVCSLAFDGTVTGDDLEVTANES